MEQQSLSLRRWRRRQSGSPPSEVICAHTHLNVEGTGGVYTLLCVCVSRGLGDVLAFSEGCWSDGGGGGGLPEGAAGGAEGAAGESV